MYMMYPMQESRKMRGFDEQRNRIRFIFIAGIAHVVPKLQPATTPSSDFRASSGTGQCPPSMIGFRRYPIVMTSRS